MKFAFVKANRSRVWPAGAICRVLGVTRQGFYQWLWREPSKHQRSFTSDNDESRLRGNRYGQSNQNQRCCA